MKQFPIAMSLVLFSNLAFAEIKKACFTIEGMTCESCAKGISKLLKHEKGVKEAEASYPKKECQVTFETKDTSSKDLESFLRKAGYRVSEADCNPVAKKAEK